MQRSRIRLLLIEDDEDDYVLTKSLLNDIEGVAFELEWAAAYEPGLASLRRNAHDVCLLDHRLGRRTGLELLGEAGGGGATAPIIFLTGQDDRSVDLEAMQAGAEDYLIKGQLSAQILERAIRYAIERRHVLDDLATAYDATIEGWARALELKDKETEGHSRRVTELTVRLAKALGIPPAEQVHVRRGALLHDIGKMGIPDAILLKAGPFSQEERSVMERHPIYAHQCLWPIKFLRPALDIPYCHHERWDGKGYPRGLAGEEIPLVARIFAVVDIWDALGNDRAYRAALPPDQVREHLAAMAGSHLDPRIVHTFFTIIDEFEAEAAPDPEDDEIHRPASPRVRSGTQQKCSSANTGDGPIPELAARVRRLEEERAALLLDNSRLAELSTTDELTGLRNRRFFREAVDRAFSFAIRQEQPFSVVALDLDHFKPYNDAYGHPAGDHVLSQVGTILRENVRSHELVARFGGEEFAILLPGSDADASRTAAERLRSVIASHPWPNRAVTASFGVATMTVNTLIADELISMADQALYAAKRNGRDRVAHYEELHARGPFLRGVSLPDHPAEPRAAPKP